MRSKKEVVSRGSKQAMPNQELFNINSNVPLSQSLPPFVLEKSSSYRFEIAKLDEVS